MNQLELEHHFEVFREDGTPGYGWQCFTCGQEQKGFRYSLQAEEDAYPHWWKQALTGQEP